MLAAIDTVHVWGMSLSTHVSHIHKDDLAKLDVEYRRLMRMIVGPPAHTNWASPWHEILNGWNNKV